MLTVIWTFLFTTFLSVFFSWAEESPVVAKTPFSEAEMILRRTAKQMSEIKSFSAEIIPADQLLRARARTWYYQRNNPDGTIESRSETRFHHTNDATMPKDITITNRKGMWSLFQKAALNLHFFQTASSAAAKIRGLPPLDAPNKIAYELAEAPLNGHKCHIVKATFPEGMGQRIYETLRLPSITETLAEAKITLPDIPIPVSYAYYIGKDDGFIYSTRSYDKKGNVLSDLTFDKVQINVSIPDEFFIIPSKLKTIIIRSPEEYSKIMVDILTHNNMEQQ